MLRAVRHRLTLLKTYRRVRSLWTEFLQIANDGYCHTRMCHLTGADGVICLFDCRRTDSAAHVAKLNEFLDSFQSVYVQYIPTLDSQSLDRIYGDCTEVEESSRWASRPFELL